jgi:hypothetical protein
MRLPSLLADLWNSDDGALISTEYILVGGVLMAGVVPGLVVARNSLNDALGRHSDTLGRVLVTPVVPPYQAAKAAPSLTINENGLTPSP